MPKAKIIQRMHLKKGKLHKDLNIPNEFDIPCELLYKIIDFEKPNGTLKNTTGIGKPCIKITPIIKKRARTAIWLKSLHGQKCKRV